jgi:oxalate---CoA ligase
VPEPLVELASDPDRPALGAVGGPVARRGALAAEVAAVAAGLVDRGLVAGDAVGLIGGNGPELAVAFLAVSSVAAAAPLDPALTAAELAFELTDLRLRAVIVVGGPPPTGATTWPEPVVSVAARAGLAVLRLDRPGGDRSVPLELAGPDLGDAEPGLDPAVALLLHTSGTTARPKTVPLTRANLVASAGAVAASLALTPGDVGLEVMPLFHVHGLVAGLLAPLHAGSSVVCAPGFHAPDVADQLAGGGITWMTAVPTMYLSLAERLEAPPGVTLRPTRPDTLPPALRVLRSSSASLAPPLLGRIERLMGVPLIEAYGMTEAAHQIASNPLPPGSRRAGTVGLAAGPQVAIRRADHDGDGWAEPGQVGEIVIRGANVTGGYRTDDPHVARDTFVEGWFRTGDQGRLDPEGYLTITGRLKEIINRGGEKISPREVDEVLLDHPAVSEAVTFAAPDPRLGEAVAAAVVPAVGATPTERDLRHFVADRLAAHKVPRRVVVVDHLPKGPTGKLVRVGLAAKLGLDDPAGLDHLDPLDGAPGPDRPAASPEVQAFVAQRWAEVLDLAVAPEPDQHFLDVGGDSLAAARLLAALSQHLALDVSMLDLFDRPTVAAQARLVEDLLLAEPEP